MTDRQLVRASTTVSGASGQAAPTAGTSRAPRSGQTPPGGKRHQARMLALQVLFEIDLTAHPVDEVLAHTREVEELPKDIDQHMSRLVRGVLAARPEIDPRIAAAAPAFPLAQIPAVDRNVLRLAMHELLNEPQVPVKSAINEAVELAKRFGGDNSSRFVNGVLGTLATGLAPERHHERAPSPLPRGAKGKKGRAISKRAGESTSVAGASGRG